MTVTAHPVTSVWILSTPGALPPWSFLPTIVTSALVIGWAHLWVPSLCFLLRCSFPTQRYPSWGQQLRKNSVGGALLPPPETQNRQNFVTPYISPLWPPGTPPRPEFLPPALPTPSTCVCHQVLEVAAKTSTRDLTTTAASGFIDIGGGDHGLFWLHVSQLSLFSFFLPFLFCFVSLYVTLTLDMSFTGASRPDPVWLQTLARIFLGLTHHKARTKKKHEEDFLQVCISYILHFIWMLRPSLW